ncbi:MAG: LolA family protein [Jatrophihabitans sp.]|uniref:LolA family protein n=1 Tax=Jatrophihabitans sp. TaxID=1932789 RepID=UPI003F80A3A9
MSTAPVRTASGLQHPPVHRRRRAAGWAFLGAAVLVAAAVVSVRIAHTGDTTAGLPVADPSYLLAPARSGELEPFVGTAVAQVSDDVAVFGRVAGAPSSTLPAAELTLAGLGAGSHTVRVWNGGPQQSRVAFVRPRSESDWFRSGSQQWFWDSSSRLAVRGTLANGATPASTLWTTAASPADLARQLLQARDTSVELAGSADVADRSVYGLVLRPTDATSLLQSAYIAIDAQTRTPLAVQLFAADQDDPVVDVSFSSIRFGPQPASAFTFRPPAGATVRSATDPAMTSVGSGWSPVLCFQLPATAATAAATAVAGTNTVTAESVQGAWGRGRLVSSSAVSVLLVDDGRTYAGPVAPEALYAVATAERPAK